MLSFASFGIAALSLLISVVAFILGDEKNKALRYGLGVIFLLVTFLFFFLGLFSFISQNGNVPTNYVSPTSGQSTSPNPPPPFFNEWINTDSETGGVRRISITAVNGSPKINMFGACSPTDCDWLESNPVQTFYYDVESETLNVRWEFSFVVTTQQLILLPDGRLKLTTHDHFIDNSGRLDFDSVEYFVRQ